MNFLGGRSRIENIGWNIARLNEQMHKKNIFNFKMAIMYYTTAVEQMIILAA